MKHNVEIVVILEEIENINEELKFQVTEEQENKLLRQQKQLIQELKTLSDALSLRLFKNQ